MRYKLKTLRKVTEDPFKNKFNTLEGELSWKRVSNSNKELGLLVSLKFPREEGLEIIPLQGAERSHEYKDIAYSLAEERLRGEANLFKEENGGHNSIYINLFKKQTKYEDKALISERKRVLEEIKQQNLTNTNHRENQETTSSQTRRCGEESLLETLKKKVANLSFAESLYVKVSPGEQISLTEGKSELRYSLRLGNLMTDSANSLETWGRKAFLPDYLKAAQYQIERYLKNPQLQINRLEEGSLEINIKDRNMPPISEIHEKISRKINSDPLSAILGQAEIIPGKDTISFKFADEFGKKRFENKAGEIVQGLFPNRIITYSHKKKSK